MTGKFAVFAVTLLSASVAWGAEKADAEKMVKSAIEYAKKNGKQNVAAAVQKGGAQFKDANTFVVIYDLQGVCVASPVAANCKGTNLMGAKDGAGNLWMKERLEIVKSKGSGWQVYKVASPATKSLDTKDVYSEVYDGYLYSAGVAAGK